jgi:hypothetical protein
MKLLDRIFLFDTSFLISWWQSFESHYHGGHFGRGGEKAEGKGGGAEEEVELEELEAEEEEELEAEEKELGGTYSFLSSRNTPPRLVVSSLCSCSRIFLSSVKTRCTSTASPVNLILLAGSFLT